MDIWVEGLRLRRRLPETARNIIFGKTRNLAREYLTSAGTIGLVVHVGAHLGQEAEAYRGMGATRVNVQGHELGVLAGIQVAMRVRSIFASARSRRRKFTRALLSCPTICLPFEVCPPSLEIESQGPGAAPSCAPGFFFAGPMSYITLVPRIPFIPIASPKLRRAPPTGPEWLHEVKFDGFRIQLHKAGDDVRLYSRNGKDFTDRFPSIAAAVLRLAARTR